MITFDYMNSLSKHDNYDVIPRNQVIFISSQLISFAWNHNLICLMIKIAWFIEDLNLIQSSQFIYLIFFFFFFGRYSFFVSPQNKLVHLSNPIVYIIWFILFSSLSQAWILVSERLRREHLGSNAWHYNGSSVLPTTLHQPTIHFLLSQQEDFAQFARNFRATIKKQHTTYLLYGCAEVPSKLREVFLSGC